MRDWNDNGVADNFTDFSYQLPCMDAAVLLTEVGLPRWSHYPIFQVSGFQNHKKRGIWNQKPYLHIGYLDPPVIDESKHLRPESRRPLRQRNLKSEGKCFPIPLDTDKDIDTGMDIGGVDII